VIITLTPGAKNDDRPSLEVPDEVALVLGRVVAELTLVQAVHLLDEAVHLLPIDQN
jgi:hypothetical protein